MRTPKINYRKNILIVERKWSKMLNFVVRLSLVLCVLAISGYLSMIMDCVDLFHAMFGNLSFSLGARALASCLVFIGLPGGLALAIALLLKAVFTFENMPLFFMMPAGENSSGWTSILGQGDGSVSSVNQPTPTNSSESSEPAGVNVIPHEMQFQQKKEELHVLVFRQFLHFRDRGKKQWQIDRSEESLELARQCCGYIVRSLEIEDTLAEYDRWLSHLRANPTTLYQLFREYTN